jgi:hypothetical protein
LNILNVGFFECPRQDYAYFIDNDEWALLMTAADANEVGASPQDLALAVLANAVARRSFFAEMTDFRAPRHFCSFLRDKIERGERTMTLEPCREGQQTCPYATFEGISHSADPRTADCRLGTETAFVQPMRDGRRI